MRRKSFSPGTVWLDNNGVPINAHGGGILFHNDAYYWFGEHKTEGENGNTAQVGVHVYSSLDLYNWQDDGIALEVSEDPHSPIARGCILERPKVIFNSRTGRFVMWFHLELKGRGYTSALSGVAFAEQVTGPFQFVAAFRPNAGCWPHNSDPTERRVLDPAEIAWLAGKKFPGGPLPWYPRQLLFRRDFATGQMARDATLFVDDDGRAYHLYASEENGTLHISELSEEYLEPSGRFTRIFPGRFHEAPALMKACGRFFLFTSGCTGWAPNPARVSAAENVLGPWEELGNPCLGTGEQTATTFHSQGTYVLPVHGRQDAFIFMADRWNPGNASDGRYVWLPIRFKHGVPAIAWEDEWDLSCFDNE